MKALLRFLASNAGYDDPLDLVEELMSDAAREGRAAETLTQLVMREAHRLESYWSGVISTGESLMGPVELKKMRWFRTKLDELQKLLASLSTGDPR